jgi:DNA-binding NarL/FixJ family response regulator
VALVLDGCSNKGIATRLRIKEQTVKNALSIIYEKVGVRTRLALALYGIKHPDRIV